MLLGKLTRCTFLVGLLITRTTYCADTIEFDGKKYPNPVQNSEPIDYSDIRHRGVDVVSTPGKAVISPIEGIVSRKVIDSVTHSKWQGIILTGVGPDKNLQVRLLGVTSKLKETTHVKKDTAVGVVQRPEDYFEKMTPYVHVELYKDGSLSDPSDWITKRWKNVRFVEPNPEMKVPRAKLEAQADQVYAEGNLERAIELYRKVITLPLHESNSFLAEHHLAHALSRKGKYEEAVRVQTTMVNRLKAELSFARDNLPGPELGIVAATLAPESLVIMISKQESNLEAYRKRQPTVFTY